MKILAIESSCDDTSASVISDGSALSNVISSQYFHAKYGGIVPELASRAHIRVISEITAQALDKSNTSIADLDALAVTVMPGLIGSLIVGSNYAKGLALRYGLPLVPVNHIEGHIYSGCLEHSEIVFPFISLVVSGGHTALFLVKSYSDYDILGLTRDDAAGEAFDKIAKLLGFDYPGGPLIDKHAKQGNEKAYDFPRSMMNSGDYNFSFSGLKTSVRYFLQREFPGGVPAEKISDIAASVQAAIVDVLVGKTLSAARKYSINQVVISGGVSANSSLRAKLAERAAKYGIKSYAPSMSYCVDNAAMIGFLAEKKLLESSGANFRNLKFQVGATALRAKK